MSCSSTKSSRTGRGQSQKTYLNTKVKFQQFSSFKTKSESKLSLPTKNKSSSLKTQIKKHLLLPKKSFWRGKTRSAYFTRVGAGGRNRQSVQENQAGAPFMAKEQSGKDLGEGQGWPYRLVWWTGVSRWYWLWWGSADGSGSGEMVPSWETENPVSVTSKHDSWLDQIRNVVLHKTSAQTNENNIFIWHKTANER